IVSREPIVYRHEEMDRDLPSPHMENPLEEEKDPWDNDDDVGVRVEFIDWMFTTWVAWMTGEGLKRGY
ncbi:hypothetical protein KI387_026146, partial [Taxus chinensis]